jgi:hypothetical protein
MVDHDMRRFKKIFGWFLIIGSVLTAPITLIIGFWFMPVIGIGLGIYLVRAAKKMR